MLRISILSATLALGLALAADLGIAATNLKLNPGLDYNSDSNDGPLITGDDMSDGAVTPGKPAHIIFYHRECYNSKRQARRTVELYEKYRGRVNFIVVDVESALSIEQKELKARFYKNYIPHVTIFDGKGNVVYTKSGEFAVGNISTILDAALAAK
ncbi:MAG: hypothetical protein ACT4NX_04545 [Deltaproteobacteria bacterium]